MSKVKNKTGRNLLFYMHAGSGNHGCEAIINSLCDILKSDDTCMSVLSNDVSEDKKYSLGDLCNLIQEEKIDKHFVAHVLYYIYRKITGNRECFMAYRYKKAGNPKNYDLAVSIGGDNYCYDVMINDLIDSNSYFNKCGLDTILLGCSIEPEILNDSRIVEDLKKYRHIISRESITTNALKSAGITNVTQIPDPAFALKPVYRKKSDTAIKDNTVGINISPMIFDYADESGKGYVWDNYVGLIRFILTETDMNVALFPHVVWERNDDRVPCNEIYKEFESEYGDRISIVSDGTCQEIKGDISRCRFFVGARTHSTIAAYSTFVPTLVVGYSVKAIGIARDLFGTEDGYVIDVRNINNDSELINGFKILMDREQNVKKSLRATIPGYLNDISGIRNIVLQCCD